MAVSVILGFQRPPSFNRMKCFSFPIGVWHWRVGSEWSWYMSDCGPHSVVIRQYGRHLPSIYSRKWPYLPFLSEFRRRNVNLESIIKQTHRNAIAISPRRDSIGGRDLSISILPNKSIQFGDREIRWTMILPWQRTNMILPIGFILRWKWHIEQVDGLVRGDKPTI